MPYTPSQNRLFRAAAHDPQIAASHHLTRAKAAMMAGEGIKMAEGGDVHPDDVRRQRLFGKGGLNDEEGVSSNYAPEIAAGAAGLAGMAALLPGKYNRMLRPIQRMIDSRAAPYMKVEARSGVNELRKSQGDAMFDYARRQADNPDLVKRTAQGRGAWFEGEGPNALQKNPLYIEQYPSTRMPLSDQGDMLKRTAQIGRGLDQQGTPLMRTIPNVRNVADEANAVYIPNVRQHHIGRMASAFDDPDMVVSHNPNKSATVFHLGDKPIEDIMSRLREFTKTGVLPKDAKPRYAVSNPGEDRLVATMNDWGKPNRTYDSLGVGPLSQSYRDGMMRKDNFYHWPIEELP